MSVLARRSIAFVISLCLAFAGTLLFGMSASSAVSNGDQSVVKVSKKKTNKTKKAKAKARAKAKAKAAKAKAKKNQPRNSDPGWTWEPNVNPRHETVNPGTGSDNPTWVDQLTEEQKICLATKAAEILTQNLLQQPNLLTLMTYLPELDNAASECGVTPPTEGEVNQMQSNVFFWYLSLSAEQKSCLSDEWQVAMDEGVQPGDDILARVTTSFDNCGVTPPFGLG